MYPATPAIAAIATQRSFFLAKIAVAAARAIFRPFSSLSARINELRGNLIGVEGTGFNLAERPATTCRRFHIS